MKIYIVGTGMDGDKTLTYEARKAIEEAGALVGARRMLEPFLKLGKPYLESSKYDEICGYIAGSREESIAVLMSGDCGFFSGARKLAAMLSGYDVRVISGISSPVYLCSRLGIPWQDMKLVSLHGMNGNIVRNVRRYGKCFFLLGGDITPADICTRLCEYGLEDAEVHIGARLAYPDERIIGGTARELSGVSCDGLCALIAEIPHPEPSLRLGMPDGGFIRGKVPMTKAEIRAVVGAKLSVGERDIVWDIGCGTGSVSVEAALAATDGTVFAVDRNDEAAALTKQNALKFGCDNIHIVRGEAPDVLDGLPAPDKVFIGGAGGHIAEILDAAFAGGNAPKVVITAVSTETLSEAAAALKSRGIDAQITQISAVRYRAVGSRTMPDPQSPVFIIEGAAE